MSGSTKSAVRGFSTPGRQKASDCSNASPTGALSNTPPSTKRRMQIFSARPPRAAECAWHDSPVSASPLRPGASALGRLGVRTAVGGALAEHARAEGDGECSGGEQRLQHHLGVHAHPPHLREVGQRQPAVGRIERSAERLTLEADLPRGVDVEEQRQHRALGGDPESPHVLHQRANAGDGQAHRQPALRAERHSSVEERPADLDHDRLERGRGQHRVVGPVRPRDPRGGANPGPRAARRSSGDSRPRSTGRRTRRSRSTSPRRGGR